jgi:hypothetical protein
MNSTPLSSVPTSVTVGVANVPAPGPDGAKTTCVLNPIGEGAVFTGALIFVVVGVDGGWMCVSVGFGATRAFGAEDPDPDEGVVTPTRPDAQRRSSRYSTAGRRARTVSVDRRVVRDQRRSARNMRPSVINSKVHQPDGLWRAGGWTRLASPK